MKRLLKKIQVVMAVVLLPLFTSAQFENDNLILIQKWKLKKFEGSRKAERDSIIEVYNKNVIFKNTKILSHKEFAHFITNDSRDYIIMEEYKDMASMEEAYKMMDELEKQAWPDEKKRNQVFDLLDKYFENWHGDELYSINNKLSK